MKLSDKLSELVDQVDSEGIADLSWRGIVEDKEWKILIHKDADLEKYNIVVKRRDRAE
jgi:hypothetical protein